MDKSNCVKLQRAAGQLNFQINHKRVLLMYQSGFPKLFLLILYLYKIPIRHVFDRAFLPSKLSPFSLPTKGMHEHSLETLSNKVPRTDHLSWLNSHLKLLNFPISFSLSLTFPWSWFRWYFHISSTNKIFFSVVHW